MYRPVYRKAKSHQRRENCRVRKIKWFLFYHRVCMYQGESEIMAKDVFKIVVHSWSANFWFGEIIALKVSIICTKMLLLYRLQK
jgi:hypothetical protein